MTALSLYIADVDDTFVINAMRVLENSGRVKVVGYSGDGCTALRQIDRLHPNVLLADTHLPMLDGIDLIRRSCGMKQPPVCIASTRFYSDVVLEATLSSGATYCIYKPISYERLPRIVTGCWESRRRKAVHDERETGDVGRFSVNRLRKLLDELDFPIRLCGSLYVVEAMLQLKEDLGLLRNLSKGLYAVLAEKQHSTPVAVERALRNAIAAAYARGSLAQTFVEKPSNRAFLEYLLREMTADEPGLSIGPSRASDLSTPSKTRELLL